MTMHRTVATIVCLPALALLAGCGGGSSSGFGFPDSGTPLTATDSGKTPGPLRLTGSDASAPPLTANDASTSGSADANGDCPPSARLIYVTGSSNQLFSYNPETADFTLIGTFDCLENPTHMTVDRTGTAWVVANSLLFTASTSNAHCTQVASWKSDGFTFSDFALSFVGTTGIDTTLYVLDDDANLASFDTATGVRTMITQLSTLSDTQGDMTSNGDGHLYFIHDVPDQTLYELTPTTGAIVSSWVTTETGGGSEALAFYGGLFYDFLDSDVYTFDPMTHVASSIGTAPLEVTGAGQSTCVPKSAPPPAVIK